MEGMVYKTRPTPTAMTAAGDLCEVVAPADAYVEILGFDANQITDFGDAQAEGLRIRAVKGNTTSGSGGTALTPAKGMTGFAAAGTVVEAFNTTAATGGTPTEEMDKAFNVQIGMEYRPLPEERITLSPSERVVFKLDGAPADSITIGWELRFAEKGG